jgi:hypothetical protein
MSSETESIAGITEATFDGREEIATVAVFLAHVTINIVDSELTTM